MDERLIHDDTLNRLADAVRLKTGSDDEMTPGQMRDMMLRTGFGNIPAHHYAEAVDVITRVRRIREASANTLIFGVITDSHVNVGTTYEHLSKTSARHASFALETVGALVPCDFLVNLGDNCWGNNIDTPADAAASDYLADCITAAFGSRTGYRLVGNHDQSMDTKKIFSKNGAYNTFDVSAATAVRGYGYTDYVHQKARVIMLNTSDYWNTTGGYDMSYEQKDFLMRALDLSDKEEPWAWQILIFSHFPLDYPDASNYGTRADVKAILDAYTAGTTVSIAVVDRYASAENEAPAAYATYSGGYLTYDYSGRNSAGIVANFHGHVHNVSFGKMADNEVVRVSAPNTCFYLEKGSVEDLYTVDTTYAKTAGTADDTAVTFYAVDLADRVIYSFAYGSGIDRLISYAGAQTYTVTYNLTDCLSSTTAQTVLEGSSFTATITPSYSDAVLSAVRVRMGDADMTADCYADGTVTIEAVTGNIVITATATVPEWSENVENVAVGIRQYWYFGSTSTLPELTPSNAYAAIGVNDVNGYGFADREGGTVYLMPVPSKATKISITNSDGSACTYRYRGVRSVGDGTLSLVFDSGEGQTEAWSWTRGSIDYLMATVLHTDGTSWAWGYDDSQIGVTFSNF